jgi:hypothetical protein
MQHARKKPIGMIASGNVTATVGKVRLRNE